MSIRGSCTCNNIQVVWHTVDRSLVPRECQCSYCLFNRFAYVSKARTRFDVIIHRESSHSIHQQAVGRANFHRCQNCGDIVFATSEIDGELYGSLNANCLNSRSGFGAPVNTNRHTQTTIQNENEWRQNWCHPVVIKEKVGPDDVIPIGKREL